jgi:FSR family fosmidomycin resistance protein-like MFS transporter
MPVIIVMAQHAAPLYAGVASSFVMGVSYAVGGLAAPIFGALADSYGIRIAMYNLVEIPIIGAAVLLFLKKD